MGKKSHDFDINSQDWQHCQLKNSHGQKKHFYVEKDYSIYLRASSSNNA